MDCAFEKGETISLGLDSFVIEDVIGRGASSIVYRAKHQKMRTKHLLKEYNPQGIELYRDSDNVLRVKNKSEQKRFDEGLDRFKAGYERQINLRTNTSLTNSICNIQRIYEGYGTKFIEMSVLYGKSYDQVTEKSLKDLLLRIKTIAKTVSCFHDMGYLLLDIKPANIFTDPGDVSTIWLFDFDSVVSMSDLGEFDDWNPSSTSGWYAPELEDEDCKDYIDGRTDVYSIGMILYYKLTGKLLKAGRKSPQKLNVPLDSTVGLFKDIDSSVLDQLIDILSHTLCSFKHRWSTEELIKKLDSLEAALSEPTQPAPTVPNQSQVNVDKVEKQISKLHITILFAAILICIPIFFLCLGSLFSESEKPNNSPTETAQLNHLQQTETTETVSNNMSTSESTADTYADTEPTSIAEDPTTPPTQSTEESTYPSSLTEGSDIAYSIDTIAYVSEDFRSLIVTNDGVVYYIDGSTIFNSSSNDSIDMLSAFDAPLENGYLAYDPYHDVVYLLAGGTLSVYDITDLGAPKLIMDNATIQLEYTSAVTPQIAVLPDGSLLVPADLDGTYRVNTNNSQITSFSRIYSLESTYSRVVGDYILEWRGGSKDATVYPLAGGQEYDIQLEQDAPYNAVCAVQDKVQFYADGIGVCEFGIGGEFSVLIAQENIRINDYQPLDYTNIWSIAANESGTVAFYDRSLDCIRLIFSEL